MGQIHRCFRTTFLGVAQIFWYAVLEVFNQPSDAAKRVRGIMAVVHSPEHESEGVPSFYKKSHIVTITKCTKLSKRIIDINLQAFLEFLRIILSTNQTDDQKLESRHLRLRILLILASHIE